MSDKTQKKLLLAANSLFVALENAYPGKRCSDPGEFLDYNAAKQYLRSLLAATRWAINTRSPHELDGSLRFQGGGVVELLQHMYRSGLRFAPPQPGGQRIYDARMSIFVPCTCSSGRTRLRPPPRLAAPLKAFRGAGCQPAPRNGRLPTCPTRLLTVRCNRYGGGNTNYLGRRQGERLLLEGRELRVGCDRNCEVLFDAGAIRRSAGARR